MLFIRPTEKNLQIARAAQIYYKKGAYAEKPVEQKSESKPVEQQKPVAEKKPVEQQKPVEQKSEDKKPAEAAEKKPEDQKKPVEQKPEDKKPAEKKPEDQKKPVEQKPEDKKPAEAAEKKPEDQKKSVGQKSEDKKPAVEPVVEVLDSKGNVVAMLPGVPEEAPKAARTTGTGFDINNFVTPPKQQKTSTKNLGQVKNVDEVYSFIRNNAVLRPFDPMPGYSINEKVAVLKTYANFNGTHPGLDELQINTLIMVFNSPDLSRKFISCGIDPKQVLGVKKFNEVSVKKYDTAGVYDFAFEYTISKKRKLVLLVNSIPTYDEKQGWMNAYSISV